MAKCYFKAVKNNKNFDFFQNVISVATLIRAYLDEKPSEINTRSYMSIRKCRVFFMKSVQVRFSQIVIEITPQIHIQTF